jgi:hypothetical protein
LNDVKLTEYTNNHVNLLVCVHCMQVANVIDCMIGALSADITCVEGTDSSGTPQLVMTTASKGYTAVRHWLVRNATKWVRAS